MKVKGSNFDLFCQPINIYNKCAEGNVGTSVKQMCI